MQCGASIPTIPDIWMTQYCTIDHQPPVYKIDFLISELQMTVSAKRHVTRGDQCPQFTGIITSINPGVMSLAGRGGSLSQR